MTTIRVHGADTAAARLDGIVARLQHLEPGMQGLLGPVLETQRRWWLTAGGGSWEPDKPQTTARDRRGGESTQLMRSSGALAAAATRRGAPGQRVDVDDSRFIFTFDRRLERYAVPLARSGRAAIAEPDAADARAYGEDLVGWIFTS